MVNQPSAAGNRPENPIAARSGQSSAGRLWRRRSSATAPTPPAPPHRPAVAWLSGVVSEMTATGSARSRHRMTNSPASAVTNADGHYSISR